MMAQTTVKVDAVKRQRSESECDLSSSPSVDSPIKKRNPDGSIILDMAPYLDAVGENDPAVVLDWDHAVCQAAVLAANLLHPVLPAWFLGAVYPITVTQFLTALIGHIGRVSGGVQGRSMLAPNTLPQCLEVRDRMRDLCFDAFLVTTYQGPLATVYVLSDAQRKTQGVRMGTFPPPGPGVQVFA
jgi:hypothetical protein